LLCGERAAFIDNRQKNFHRDASEKQSRGIFRSPDANTPPRGINPMTKFASVSAAFVVFAPLAVALMVQAAQIFV
jgi:hypothetical protein